MQEQTGERDVVYAVPFDRMVEHATRQHPRHAAAGIVDELRHLSIRSADPASMAMD